MTSSLVYDSVTGLRKDSDVTSSEIENNSDGSLSDQTESASNHSVNSEGRKSASINGISDMNTLAGDEVEGNEEAPGLWDKLVNTFSEKKESEEKSTIVGNNFKTINSTVDATEKASRTAKSNETTYEKVSDSASESSPSGVSDSTAKTKDDIIANDLEDSNKRKDFVTNDLDSLADVSKTRNNDDTNKNGGFVSGNSNSDIGTETTANNSPNNTRIATSGSDLSAPLITLDHSAGSYSSSINVKMSSSESGKVYYCLGLNGCCTPTQWVSNNFNITPILVGLSDGNYCLSVMAEDLSGNRSDILKQQYTINSNAPNISVSYNSKLYLQTTEAMQVIVTSSKFGRSSYNYWALNIHNNILANSCSDIVNQYSQSTYGIGLPVSFDSLSLSDQIEFSLDKSNLNYGENYIAQIVHNSTLSGESSYSCPVQKIVLEDFEFKPMNVIGRMPASNTNNITEFQGGVSSFGYFSPTPSTKKSGAGRVLSTDQSLYLESGIVNILN